MNIQSDYTFPTVSKQCDILRLYKLNGIGGGTGRGHMSSQSFMMVISALTKSYSSRHMIQVLVIVWSMKRQGGLVNYFKSTLASKQTQDMQESLSLVIIRTVPHLQRELGQKNWKSTLEQLWYLDPAYLPQATCIKHWMN